MVNRDILEQVTSFSYLRHMITDAGGRSSQEIRKSVEIATILVYTMKRYWNSQKYCLHNEKDANIKEINNLKQNVQHYFMVQKYIQKTSD